MAEIISIHVVRERNTAAESCNQVTVRSNFGIVGDYRSGKFQIGQITLIETETIDVVSRELGYEIPAGSSRRQIMVKGIKLNELIDRNLRMGQILVRVEDRCNPCKKMETKIGPGAKDAMNDKGGIRCRIIEGGDLHVGDKITVEIPRCPYYARLSSFCFKFISYLKQLSNKT
ncbi:MAG: MOSC domain-containing protein [Candidatus Scalindua sp.]|nr:MOSC domain-containing protein [Candidatus Scalindua sp.]MCR4343511.1 MOSC domain-containing protein [Candidatus Scalindua sp.]